MYVLLEYFVDTQRKCSYQIDRLISVPQLVIIIAKQRNTVLTAVRIWNSIKTDVHGCHCSCTLKANGSYNF